MQHNFLVRKDLLIFKWLLVQIDIPTKFLQLQSVCKSLLSSLLALFFFLQEKLMTQFYGSPSMCSHKNICYFTPVFHNKIRSQSNRLENTYVKQTQRMEEKKKTRTQFSYEMVYIVTTRHVQNLRKLDCSTVRPHTQRRHIQYTHRQIEDICMQIHNFFSSFFRKL